jgi:hypothetical protein
MLVVVGTEGENQGDEGDELLGAWHVALDGPILERR